ncbi:MAG TPA: hypothetical protein VFW73_01705 [Lacipirellulaceae bacterium]|nr:hypothetical protein [Lacipirellulaceae bacterium]
MDDDNVRITVSVSPLIAAKIDELAGRMKTSSSRMASELLEAGLESDEWIIKFVTSEVFTGLRDALKSVGRKKRKSAR